MIIHAEENHLELIVPLFDGYRMFYQQESDIAKAQQFIGERLRNKDSVIFIAMQNDIAVGFTQLYPSFSSVSAQHSYILNDLYVIPALRGKGIGKTLLQKAQQFTIEKTAKGLELSTANDNPAQYLYEQLGWQKDTEFLHYFWKA